MSYLRVPIEVLEDPGELTEWARAAIRAANAAPRPKRKAPRAANRRRGAAKRNSCAIFGRLAANDA